MKKVIAITLVLVLIANIVLFALSLTNALIFWLVIALSALIAYKVMPDLNTEKKGKK